MKNQLSKQEKEGLLSNEMLIKNKIQTQPSFTLLPQNGMKQILQINFPPLTYFYTKGNIVYSNYTEENMSLLVTPFKQQFQLLYKPFSMYKCINNSNRLQIVGLSHPIYKGPILVLQISVYKQNLYISAKHILASRNNLEFNLKNDKMHRIIPGLFLIQQTKSLFENYRDHNRQIVICQANSPIIQKQLGSGEQFYLGAAQIIALSETIKVQTEKNYLKLTGPGWIFFQTEKIIQRNSAKNTCIALLIYVIFTGFLFTYAI